MKNKIFNKITLIGLGLIGSSICHAARKNGLVKNITGYARRQETLDIAMDIGFIDIATTDLKTAVKDSDLIIICTPVSSYKSIGKALKPYLKKGMIVSDVGSTKKSVIKDLKPFMNKDISFIPAHPIAGTENSGPAAGFSTLFEDRYCIITPDKELIKNKKRYNKDLKKLKLFWQKLGSKVELMNSEHHDRVLAITSHLPHLIAYSIVMTASDLEQNLLNDKVADNDIVATSEVLKYSASGFRDFTRIAGSDPVMWRDVFLNNDVAVLEMLGRFQEDLLLLQRAIRNKDGDKLQEWFSKTKGIRRGIIEHGQAGTFSTIEQEKFIKITKKLK